MSRAAVRYATHRPALMRDLVAIVSATHRSRFRATELLVALRERGAPWVEWLPGRPLTAKALSMMLLPLGVRTEKVRVGDHCFQFYRRDDLLRGPQ